MPCLSLAGVYTVHSAAVPSPVVASPGARRTVRRWAAAGVFVVGTGASGCAAPPSPHSPRSARRPRHACRLISLLGVVGVLAAPAASGAERSPPRRPPKPLRSEWTCAAFQRTAVPTSGPLLLLILRADERSCLGRQVAVVPKLVADPNNSIFCGAQLRCSASCDASRGPFEVRGRECLGWGRDGDSRRPRRPRPGLAACGGRGRLRS